MSDKMLMENWRKFLAEIEVEYNSKLAGIKVMDNSLKELADSNILFVQRGEHAFYPPVNNITLKEIGRAHV